MGAPGRLFVFGFGLDLLLLLDDVEMWRRPGGRIRRIGLSHQFDRLVEQEAGHFLVVGHQGEAHADVGLAPVIIRIDHTHLPRTTTPHCRLN